MIRKFLKSFSFSSKILEKKKNYLMNLKFLKLYKTETGKYYLPYFAKYDIIKRAIINNQVFDEEIYNNAKEFIKPNSIVLDVGSNYGQLSILYSQLNKNVEVHSFEADPYIYKILKKNILINNAKVNGYNYIVGDQNNTQFILEEKLSEKNYFTYGSKKINIVKNFSIGKKVKSVKSIKIDDLKFNKKISFMKIDTQGYDLKVLIGSEKTIKNHKMPIIFEFEEDFKKEFNYDFKDFENFIKVINYRISKELKNNNYLILPR